MVPVTKRAHPRRAHAMRAFGALTAALSALGLVREILRVLHMPLITWGPVLAMLGGLCLAARFALAPPSRGLRVALVLAALGLLGGGLGLSLAGFFGV